MSENRLIIGVYLEANKKELLNWKECERLASLDNIIFQDLDGQKEISSQGTFSLILCKLTKEIAQMNQKDSASNCINNFTVYSSLFPHVPWIDNLSIQHLIMSREKMGAICNSISKEIKGMKEIGSILISNQQELHSPQFLNFPFPAIAKSTLSGGSVESHEMGVLFNPLKIGQFSMPFLVQQYLNHNGTILKVFVVGETLKIKIKASLPNFYFTADREPLMFNSQSFTDLCKQTNALITENDLDMDKIHQISDSIKKHTSLALFGFDVIICEKTGDYALIDINYFPGYRGVSNFPEQLTSLIKNKIKPL